jgi:methionine biosynthesis protein MetW
MTLRPDLDVISNWVKPGSSVLDLGCGDGTLLRHLADERNVTGYGLELNMEKVTQCVRKRVNVLHADLNSGLNAFDENDFDYVVMTHALQMVAEPDKLLLDMARVGREVIVTFPNFGNWRTRLSLLGGRMPVTKALPDSWYNTPNIHLCTVRDFEALCADLDIEVIKPLVLSHSHTPHAIANLLPNLFGQVAMYHVRKR